VLLLLVGFGLTLGGLALEAAVRLFVPVSDYFWEWDPAVGVKLIPGKHGRAISRGRYDAPVEINSHGFRDRERTYDKPPGTIRVELLGDSFIEALQVPFDSSLPALLEKRLRDAAIQAETVNLGVSGAGTARQYLMLEHYGLRYHPDLVLLFFVGNDFSDNSRRLQGLPYIPYPIPDGTGSIARDGAGRPLFAPFADQSSRLGPVAAALRSHSRAYRLLRETINDSPQLHGIVYRLRLMSTPPEPLKAGPSTFGFYEIYRSQYRAPWVEAWGVTKEMLLETRSLAEANGARFAVVLVPAAWEVYPGTWERTLARVPAMRAVSLDLDKPSRLLTSFLEAHGIPYVSLLADFRARASTAPPLYIDNDGHWTAAGHRLAADLLAGPVAELIGGGRRRPAPGTINGARHDHP
jgi:lysophospholipase L1-like esterase